MSRTDKDRPYWVQLRDPGFKWPIRASHSCTGTHYRNSRECDLDFPLPKTRSPLPKTRRSHRGCAWWPRYADNDKIYGRSNWRRSWGSFQDRRARGKLRELRHDWLRTDTQDRQDIDSLQDAPTQHWLWLKWYWD